MNYQEALAYLYSLSNFERGGPYTRNPEENLPRESRLLEVLGNPQLNYTNTLIAGTKGKGSTAAFIERVLREAGVRTGLYTQPDLHTFRERIRVNIYGSRFVLLSSPAGATCCIGSWPGWSSGCH